MKILAMDGGNGINTADLLQRLETATVKNYLDQVNIFAGTSAGGINSLFFAASDNPTAALATIQKFWSDVNRSILEGMQADEVVRKALAGAQSNPLAPVLSDQWQDIAGSIFRTILGLGEAAAGCRSLFLNDVLKKFLIQYFGATTTIGDLKRFVVIVSYELDNGKPGIARSWVPRLFTNLPYTPVGPKGAMKAATSPDSNELVVDVALRTAAAPLELPIYQSSTGTGPGYVDGGLVANNPAMIALSAIVGTLASGNSSAGVIPPTESLSQIYMLSIGTGRNLVGTAQYLDPEFKDGSAPWGYRQWLFNPADPLVLIDAFLQGGNEATAWECGILMGGDHFHRLNVPLEHMLVPTDPETAAWVADTALWLEKSPWYTQSVVGLSALLKPLGGPVPGTQSV
jgi:uncharacterized protein